MFRSLYRSRRAAAYILREMIPVLLIGVVVFVLILLMFQALRLTEFILVHGVTSGTIGKITLYLSISFLSAILPMSLLFAVLFTYSRLSGDSEIVALKSVGLNMKQLAAPAVFLGLVVALLSAKISFELAPWGNRQFELLITQLGQSKASMSIREGVFSEGFFDLVVYANKVDSKKGTLKNVFIYDERDSELPLTIIAREGVLVQDKEETAQTASIRLIDGNIHRASLESNTKIDFETYDLNLSDPIKEAFREKSILSMNHDELLAERAKRKADPKTRIKLTVEYHKRWALAVGCVLFALIGVGLGTTTNRRNVRSGAMVTCLGLIVIYWILYVTCENLAVNGHLPAVPVVWATNFVFSILAFWSLKHSAV